MNYKNYKIFLIAGGTAGHIYPALNLSKLLSSKGISNLIVTDHRGINFINKNKFNTKVIYSSHLNKKNISFLKGIIFLIIGFFQYTFLLIQKKPRKIITFGSYASFIPILCTFFFKKILKTKIYFHEQNSIIGKVHNIFLFVTEKIFITFKDTKGIKNKFKNKIVYSGIPISNEINKFYKKQFKLKRKKINILVIGGSQGASNLAKIIIEILYNFSNDIQKLVNLTIQAPKSDIFNLKLKLNKTKIRYQIKSFYEDIIRRISISDLCITRAGASTIFELIKLNKPSILVPLPSATNNHQYYNAKYLSNKKASIIIKEKDLSKKNSSTIIKKMILNQNLLKKMYLKLNNIQDMDSNKIIYQEIFENEKIR